jgi:hypothetical protein
MIMPERWYLQVKGGKKTAPRDLVDIPIEDIPWISFNV